MKKYQTASYMMVCLDDFTSKFLIPAKFVKKYREIAAQISVTLETDSGKTWDVKIKRDDGDLYMKDGWSDFAVNNRLTGHDFLTFRWLRRTCSFKVTVYGKNGCLKQFPPTPPTSSVCVCHENVSNSVNGRRVKGVKRGRGRPRTRSKIDNIAHDEDVDQRWRFVRELKHHNFTTLRMDIPEVFVWGTRMPEKIQLEDEEGGKWMVSVTDRNKGVFSMTRGWAKYLKKGSGAQVGDILMFEFAPSYGNVVRVRVMEDEAGRDMLARAKKGGMIYF